MAGLRKLIYVPSEEIWLSVKKSAAGENRSVSNYLINLHLVGGNCSEVLRSGVVSGPKDSIKSKAIARGKDNLGKSDPVAEMAAGLAEIIEEKVTAKDKHIFTKPKKKSKSLPSGCSECKAPFGHRFGCSLGAG